MKLSDAIRKGCEGTGQEFGNYFGIGTSCALGAALVGATGGNHLLHLSETIILKVVGVENFETPCPYEKCLYEHKSLAFIVSHLNDHHKWTREAIADWVEREFESGARLAEEAPSLQMVGGLQEGICK